MVLVVKQPMQLRKFTTAINTTSSTLLRQGAVFVLGILLVIGLSWFMALAPISTSEPAVPVDGIEKTDLVVSSSTLRLPESEPVRLSIPAAGITTDFSEPLYVEDNGEIEVPDSFTTVGYYGYGPTPGELGPAVVLGHVDSYQGPAVFWTLGQVNPGDLIEIERADGEIAVFAVTRLERHLQSGFPTEQVYGDIDHAGLRLITCSGTYDRGRERYTHNLIVFAELVGTSTTSVTSTE